MGTALREQASLSAFTDDIAFLVKTRFWQHKSGMPLNEGQIKLLNRLLDGFDGKLTSCEWASIAKCSADIVLAPGIRIP